MKNREGLPQLDKKISTENSWLTTITVNGEKLDAFIRRSVKCLLELVSKIARFQDRTLDYTTKVLNKKRLTQKS